MNLRHIITRLSRIAQISITLTLVALVFTLLDGTSANAQRPFDSGSTGEDGPLDFTDAEPGSTILFDPTTFDPRLDPEDDSIYHFTSITVPEGITVRLRADILGNQPLIWLASGAVVIGGMLDLNGEKGHDYNAEVQTPAIAGVGGFSGGIGATALTAAHPGSGLGGG